MSGPDRPERTSAPGGPAARVVWALWAVLSVALLGLALTWARNVPYWDDWKLVPVLYGAKAASLAWFWEQSNEHRSPLAKLLLWALARLSGGELRCAMLACALLLCAVAAAAVRAVAVLSGRLRWSDLALPVLFLNWGHQENVLWQIELHFVLPVAAFTLALLLLLRVAHAAQPAISGAGLGWRLAFTAGLLPLQSAVGLCLSLPLAAWMLWAAPRLTAPSQRRALRLCALLMLALAALYLANRPSSPASDRGFMGVPASALTALRVLSMGIGEAGRELWPWAGMLVAAAGLGAVAWLLATLRRAPEQRLGASLLLIGVLAGGGLALAIGVSRAGLGWSAGFAPRYASLMAPGLLCVYLAFRLYGPARTSRLLAGTLCACLLLVLPVNTVQGLRAARQRAAVLDAFAADVRAGRSPSALAGEHAAFLCPDPAVLRARLELLQQQRLWIYGEVGNGRR